MNRNSYLIQANLRLNPNIHFVHTVTLNFPDDFPADKIFDIITQSLLEKAKEEIVSWTKNEIVSINDINITVFSLINSYRVSDGK